MTFLEILILIFAIALSIIAIRISLKFDINKFLENRRKIKLAQLKNICPHGGIIDIMENQVKFESYFSSPVGTLNWVCSQCGCIVDHEDDVNRINERYKKNPHLILEKQKRFIKEAKKLKIV